MEFDFSIYHDEKPRTQSAFIRKEVMKDMFDYEELLLMREAVDYLYSDEWLTTRKEKLKKLYNKLDLIVKGDYKNES